MFSAAHERRRTSRGAIPALALLSVLAIACVFRSRASAQAERELELAWRSAPECPDAAWADRRMRERLGRAPDGTREGPGLKARAELTRAGDRFSLTLLTTLGDAASERQLEAATCADLAEAAVLMVALAVDPDAVARSEAGAPPEPAHDDERPPALTPAPPAPPPAPRSLHWAAGAALLGSRGDQPGWGIGAAAFMAREWAWLRVELAGLWLLPRAGSEAPAVGRVRVSLWALRPTMCASSQGRALRLGGCLGAELGRVGGVGRSLGESLQDHTLWGALSAGPRGTWRITRRLGLVLEALAVFPVFQPRFVTTDATGTAERQLYAPAPVVARATLALEARF
jgi:hypothetical protein